MDLDFCDPTNPAHMELVAMMMQMEKLPEFSEIPPPSVIDFSGGSMVSSSSSPPYYVTPPSASPAMISPSSTISFGGNQQMVAPFFSDHGIIDPSTGNSGNKRGASMAAMREMIFRLAAMQPVHIDPESVKPPKRRNVKISKDPQSVAARHRRERISERIRILQRLVPGGTKMDTASMLDEAIHYVKFLKTQVQSLERVAANRGPGVVGFSSSSSGGGGGGDMYQNFDQQQYMMNPTQILR